MRKKRIDIRKKLAVMVLCLLSALPAVASDFVTDDSLRFYHDVEQSAAYLTYQALDSANASAYSGELLVPSMVCTPQGEVLPVLGVTAVACVCCRDLKEVTLSTGIESIGYAAFSDCPSLTEVSLPTSLTTLSDLSFYRDVQLQSIDVPQGVSRVGAGAFSFCYTLADVTLSDGIASIAPHAFYLCSSLTQLVLPSTLRQLGQYAFAYCSSLQRIEVHTPPLAITDDVFEGLDCSQCQLIVPVNQVDAYQAAPVWQEFQIVAGDWEGIDDVMADDAELLQVYPQGDVLHVCVLGDAPALIYDLQGHRLAVCGSGSGDNALSLPVGHTYIIRCGHTTRKVSY